MVTSVKVVSVEAEFEADHCPARIGFEPGLRRASGRFSRFSRSARNRVLTELAKRGIVLEDGPTGTTWRRAG